MNKFCSACGAAHTKDAWPRECTSCGHIHYRNPIPVALVLVPVGDGVLLVRRGIEPKKGELALPGGFMDFGETWAQAGAREVYEEIGLKIDPNELKHFKTTSTPDGARVLIFCYAPKQDFDPSSFLPNEETLEVVLATEYLELAFPTHTEIFKEFLQVQCCTLASFPPISLC